MGVFKETPLLHEQQNYLRNILLSRCINYYINL